MSEDEKSELVAAYNMVSVTKNKYPLYAISF